MTAVPMSAARAKPAAASALSRLLAAAGRWYVERRTLAALARLDEHLLHDIGVAGATGPRAVRRMLRSG